MTATLIDTLDHFTTSVTNTITQVIMDTAQELTGSARVPANLIHIKSPSARPQSYSCTACNTGLAHSADLVSKRFNGSHGKAYLFTKVNNVVEGTVKGSSLTSGYHEICDITCQKCGITLGWKYIQATEASQRYKEGKYILERNLITANDDIQPAAREVSQPAQTPADQNTSSLQLLSGQFSMAAGVCMLEVDNITAPQSFSVILHSAASSSDKNKMTFKLPTIAKSEGESLAKVARNVSGQAAPLLTEDPFAMTVRPLHLESGNCITEVVQWFVCICDKKAVSAVLGNGQRKLFTLADAQSHLDERDKAILNDAIKVLRDAHLKNGAVLVDLLSKLTVNGASSTNGSLASSVLLEGETDWNVVNDEDDDFEDVPKP